MADKKKKSSKTKTAAPAKSSALKAAEAKAEQIVNAQSKDKDKGKSKGKKQQNGIVRYFKELKSEMKKVVWPSRKTVLNNTGVVLAVMSIAAVVVAGLDSVYTSLLKFMLEAAAK